MSSFLETTKKNVYFYREVYQTEKLSAFSLTSTSKIMFKDSYKLRWYWILDLHV